MVFIQVNIDEFTRNNRTKKGRFNRNGLFFVIIYKSYLLIPSALKRRLSFGSAVLSSALFASLDRLPL